MSEPAPEPRGGVLYVVATPIGNLGDLSVRALQILRGVDRILCEDTRVTRTLCEHFAIRAPLLRHESHNEAASAAGAVNLLAAGESLALVSDAGMPGISDPGQRLVAVVTEAGHDVVVIPGPSAVATAIAGSGLGATGYRFWGFVPKKAQARAGFFAALEAGTHAAFVPARDLVTVLTALRATQPDARVVVARELTKRHESWYRGAVADVLDRLTGDADAAKGEAVLVVNIAAPEVTDDALRAALRRELASGTSVKDASRAVADAFGVHKRHVYQLALALPRRP